MLEYRKLLKMTEPMNPLVQIILWLLDTHKLQYIKVAMNDKVHYVSFRIKEGDVWEF